MIFKSSKGGCADSLYKRNQLENELEQFKKLPDLREIMGFSYGGFLLEEDRV